MGKAKMSKKDREDVRRLYMTDMPVSEIARMYGISENYVYSLCSRDDCRRMKQVQHIYAQSTDSRKAEDAITPEMIRKEAAGIYIGGLVTCLDTVEECEGRPLKSRRNKYQVVGKSRYLFTIKRNVCLESFSYIDLIRKNGVMA